MRKTMFPGSTLTLILVLSACGGIKVSTDFDSSTDFTRYRTFAWMAGLGGGTDPRVSGDLMDQRFRRAIESELVSKGMAMVGSGQPDVFVGYQVALNDQVNYETINTYWGSGWGYRGVYGSGMVSSQTVAREYTVGTLVIDVFDARRRELVWRGAGEGRVNAARDPDERQERINEAVFQIMEDFPVR